VEPEVGVRDVEPDVEVRVELELELDPRAWYSANLHRLISVFDLELNLGFGTQNRNNCLGAWRIGLCHRLERHPCLGQCCTSLGSVVLATTDTKLNLDPQAWYSHHCFVHLYRLIPNLEFQLAGSGTYTCNKCLGAWRIGLRHIVERHPCLGQCRTPFCSVVSATTDTMTLEEDPELELDPQAWSSRFHLVDLYRLILDLKLELWGQTGT